MEVVLDTSPAADWYTACAILSGGLVVTIAAASVARVRPKLSLRAKPLFFARILVHAESFLIAAVLITPTALALVGHYVIGKDAGTAWGRLLPSLGVLAVMVLVAPVSTHPSWTEAKRIGPLRTWWKSVSWFWTGIASLGACGGLALMGVLQTWDGLAANIVAYVIALLYPYQPDLKSLPSRNREDLGESLLLVPGIIQTTMAYALDPKTDDLIRVAVPADPEGTGVSLREAEPVRVIVDADGVMTKVAGELPDAATTSRPLLSNARPRRAGDQDRNPFPRDLTLPRWESLSVQQVALELLKRSREESSAHGISWADDCLRKKSRWSLRAMVSALVNGPTDLVDVLQKALDTDTNQLSSADIAMPALLVDRLFALGTIGLMLTNNDHEATDGAGNDGSVEYWEWVTEKALLEQILTMPCASPTPDAVRSTGVSALVLLRDIYGDPEKLDSYFEGNNIEQRVRDEKALTGTHVQVSNASDEDSMPSRGDGEQILAADKCADSGNQQQLLESYAEGEAKSAHSAAEEPDDDIPWPFVSMAILLENADREYFSGDCETPGYEFSDYTAEFIRRYVSRGLLLIQATTFAYALAGAVVTELLR